jgi:hypothetical protein
MSLSLISSQPYCSFSRCLSCISFSTYLLTCLAFLLTFSQTPHSCIIISFFFHYPRLFFLSSRMFLSFPFLHYILFFLTSVEEFPMEWRSSNCHLLNGGGEGGSRNSCLGILFSTLPESTSPPFPLFRLFLAFSLDPCSLLRTIFYSLSPFLILSKGVSHPITSLSFKNLNHILSTVSSINIH